ncbi:MAG: hypothetical protein HKN43_15635 [Rhodothermales bacterium]|nr:hypothetical protein [Rhodothermales bacterium]
MRISSFSILVVALLASACSPKQSTDDTDDVMTALVIENLGRGHSGSLTDTTEAVYRTPAQWRPVAETLSPLEPFPEFDTTQYMVLLAAIPTPSGGFQVQFESVEATEEELIATYELSVPGHDCLTITALSVAFQAVAVPRYDLPVRFEREERYYSCSTR